MRGHLCDSTAFLLLVGYQMNASTIFYNFSSNKLHINLIWATLCIQNNLTV